MAKGKTSVSNDLRAQYSAQTLCIINDQYAKLFPGNRGTEPQHTQKMQRLGRSRIVWDENDEPIYVQERYGFSHRNYLHLEMVKNTATGQLGWLENENFQVQYMAFIHLADGVVYLFEWEKLREVWEANKAYWKENFKDDEAWNPGYDTTFLKVPARVVMRLMGKHAKAVTFPPIAPEILDVMKGRGKYRRNAKPQLESLRLL
jgi:hypothetical protein